MNDTTNQTLLPATDLDAIYCGLLFTRRVDSMALICDLRTKEKGNFIGVESKCTIKNLQRRHGRLKGQCSMRVHGAGLPATNLGRDGQFYPKRRSPQALDLICDLSLLVYNIHIGYVILSFIGKCKIRHGNSISKFPFRGSFATVELARLSQSTLTHILRPPSHTTSDIIINSLAVTFSRLPTSVS